MYYMDIWKNTYELFNPVNNLVLRINLNVLLILYENDLLYDVSVYSIAVKNVTIQLLKNTPTSRPPCRLLTSRRS